MHSKVHKSSSTGAQFENIALSEALALASVGSMRIHTILVPVDHSRLQRFVRGLPNQQGNLEQRVKIKANQREPMNICSL